MGGRHQHSGYDLAQYNCQEYHGGLLSRFNLNNLMLSSQDPTHTYEVRIPPRYHVPHKSPQICWLSMELQRNADGRLALKVGQLKRSLSVQYAKVVVSKPPDCAIMHWSITLSKKQTSAIWNLSLCYSYFLKLTDFCCWHTFQPS